jgi:hypothetical protein
MDIQMTWANVEKLYQLTFSQDLPNDMPYSIALQACIHKLGFEEVNRLNCEWDENAKHWQEFRDLLPSCLHQKG